MNHLLPDANLLFDYELEKITLPVLRYAVTSARFTYQSHRFPFHGIQIYFSLCIRRIRVLVRMPFPLRAVFNAPHQPVYGLSGKTLAVMGRQIIVKIQILHTFQCIVLCFNRHMVLKYKAHNRCKHPRTTANGASVSIPPPTPLNVLSAV